jgi:hypothetical protein
MAIFSRLVYAGRVAMRVGDEWREWPAEAECVVFDDSFEHEVSVQKIADADFGGFGCI